jgi:hypothetical protein
LKTGASAPVFFFSHRTAITADPTPGRESSALDALIAAWATMPRSGEPARYLTHCRRRNFHAMRRIHRSPAMNVPHLVTALKGPLLELERRVLAAQPTIEHWLRGQMQERTIPFYCSRRSTPIFFPAGSTT